MPATQTNAARVSSVDPVLERLHEVTERIRRRAAEARAREAARQAARTLRAAPALRSRQGELPLGMPRPARLRAVPAREALPAQSPLALRSVSQE